MMLIVYERRCRDLFTAVTNPVILDQWPSLRNRMEKDSGVHSGTLFRTDNPLIPSQQIRTEVLNRSSRTPHEEYSVKMIK